MNPQDPLAQLHPLREPELISWWPLAPGWWLLAAALLCAIAIAIWLLWRNYRANAYRRQGLRQLEQLRRELQIDGDISNHLCALNALLKSVALQAYPRREIAGASGQQWLDFLNHSMETDLQFHSDFALAGYQQGQATLDTDALHLVAVTWIKRHRRSR